MCSERGTGPRSLKCHESNPSPDSDNGPAQLNHTRKARRSTSSPLHTPRSKTRRRSQQPQKASAQNPNRVTRSPLPTRRLARDSSQTCRPARRSPGLAALHGPSLGCQPCRLGNPTLECQHNYPRQTRRCPLDAHPNLPLLHGPSFGCQPADSDSVTLYSDPISPDKKDVWRPSGPVKHSPDLAALYGPRFRQPPLTRSPIPVGPNSPRPPPRASP